MTPGVNVTPSTAAPETTTASFHSPGDLPDPLRYLYVAYLVLIIALGVPGNILIALVYGRIKNRTTCDWFILFMSVTDCIVCSVSPVLHLRYELQINVPWMKGSLCGLEHWLQLTAMMSSCHYLTAIAIDRYVKICHSRLPALKPKFAPYACLAGLVASAGGTVYFTLDSFKDQRCGLFDPRRMRMLHRIYFTLVFCGFVICFVLVTFAYWNVCKQIFKKVRTKQRLLENNGLQQTPTPRSAGSVKRGDSENPAHRIRFRTNWCSRICPFLYGERCFGGFLCCSRHVPGHYEKSDVPTDDSNGKRMSDQVLLTKVKSAGHSSDSSDIDNGIKSSERAVPADPLETGDNCHLLSHVHATDTDKDGSLPLNSIPVNKELSGSEQRERTPLHSGADNLKSDVSDPPGTVLSGTTSSCPSIGEEIDCVLPEDLPVVFFLPDAETKKRVAKDKTYQIDLASMESNLLPECTNCAEDPKSSVQESALMLSSNELAHANNMRECVKPNVYENKLSLTEDIDHAMLPVTDRVCSNGACCQAERSGVQADTRPPVYTLLTSARSQSLVWPSGSRDRFCRLLAGIESVEDHTNAGKSGASRDSLGDARYPANTSNTPPLTRSHSTGALHYTKSTPSQPHRTHAGYNHRPIAPQDRTGVKRLQTSGINGSGRPDPGESNVQTFSIATPSEADDDQQETIDHASRASEKMDPSAMCVQVSETVSTHTPSLQDTTSDNCVVAKNNSIHLHTAPSEPSSTEAPTLSQQTHSSPITDTHASVKTSRKLFKRKANHCHSIESYPDGHTKEEDYIEDDLPTGSFMRKWRSEMRRRTKGLRTKHFTSSGKSALSCQRFVREKQITFMLISVTLTFLLASVPSWIVWVTLIWDPNALPTGMASGLITTGTVGLYLLNFVSSWFIFYAFNPSFRSKCHALVPCLPAGTSRSNTSSAREGEVAQV